MGKERNYTSMGNKLIHHPEVIALLQKNRAVPVSIQVAPTSRCQLKCSFCSNVNRKKNEDIEYSVFLTFLRTVLELGAKTVEWTGGGDPTLHPDINKMIQVANSLKLEQGLITNGLGFDNIDKKNLSLLKWVRISMNCLDYVDKVDLPKLSKGTTLGFSYVMNNNTTLESLGKLSYHVKKYAPKYVRVVPNCQASEEEQIRNNKHYAKKIAKIGEPYFYQAKVFEKPNKCYWGYFKPFLLHDGFVYRCSSVVLNDDAERSFHNKYRWCHASELFKLYHKRIDPYIPKDCDKCVFTNQNNLIDSIISPNEMINFI